MGKGAFPDDNPLSLLAVGIDKKGPAAHALERADCIITVGYDFVEYAPSYWNPRGDTTIVHVDGTPAEVDMNYQPSVQLVGNISQTLQILRDQFYPHSLGYEAEVRKEVMNEAEDGSDDSSFPMKPKRVLKELRKALGREDILVSDVGEHKNWISRLFPAYEPNTVVISNGYSSMGISIPGAIAAKLAQPDRTVVAVCGDGGFMMTCNELETAQRLGTNFVTVVFRDGAYGSIKRKQLAKYKRTFGVAFENPDLTKLAEAFKLEGYRPENSGDLVGVLREAISSKRLEIVDVPVDYS